MPAAQVCAGRSVLRTGWLDAHTGVAASGVWPSPQMLCFEPQCTAASMHVAEACKLWLMQKFGREAQREEAAGGGQRR